MADPPSLPRKSRLFTSNDVAVTLVYYPPGLIQPDHAHHGPQMSVLLAGGFREQTGQNDTEPSQRVSALKSAGARHAVRFGRHGALMLSMDLGRDLPLPVRQAGDWRPLSQNAHALAATLLGTSDRQDVVDDLMAEIREASPLVGLSPPAAVQRLKEALDDDPAHIQIRDMAQTLDVHRVHLSRAFSAAYGLPPSLYRRRRMTAHALALTCRDRLPLAHIAAEAGFADQSHMNRAFRHELGLNPAKLRRLFSVTSVQDANSPKA
ncbi:MAG: helix-turn-helix domain-containing protein [Asticcacaulis sp.]